MCRAALCAGLVTVLASPVLGASQPGKLSAVRDLAPLQRVGEVERYTPDNLWERINGEAELYRVYGLEEAAFAYFEHPNDPDRAVEAALFKMSDPLAAFGLYTSFRDPAATAIALGNGGCSDDYQALAWHGETFVKLNAFGSATSRPDDLARAIAAVATALGPAPAAPPLLTRLTPLLSADSMRWHPDHLFGRTVLPPGLSGQDSAGVEMFVSVPLLGEAAVWAALRSSLREMREVRLGSVIAVQGIDPDLGAVVLGKHVDRLIGVLGEMDKVVLEAALSSLAQAVGAH